MKKIILDLKKILNKKNLKETDKISDLEIFDSIIVLQIINLAKIKYKKEVDAIKITKAERVSDIIKILN